MKFGKAIQTGVIMCAGKEDSVYKKCLSGESAESAESVVSVTSDEVFIMSSLSLSLSLSLSISLSLTHTHTLITKIVMIRIFVTTFSCNCVL